MSAKQCYGTERHSRAEQEELAALIAVVAALAEAAAAAPPAPASAWADPVYRLRTPLHPVSQVAGVV